MNWKFGDLLVSVGGEPCQDLLVMFICWQEEGDTIFMGAGIVDDDEEMDWQGQVLPLSMEDWRPNAA